MTLAHIDFARVQRAFAAARSDEERGVIVAELIADLLIPVSSLDEIISLARAFAMRLFDPGLESNLEVFASPELLEALKDAMVGACVYHRRPPPSLPVALAVYERVAAVLAEPGVPTTMLQVQDRLTRTFAQMNQDDAAYLDWLDATQPVRPRPGTEGA